MILSTPNFAFLYNRFRIARGQLSSDEGYHYRFFTVASLTRQLNAAGLAVDVHAHTTPAIGVNIVRSRILKRPRLHVHMPLRLAPLLGHTLFVRAMKT